MEAIFFGKGGEFKQNPPPNYNRDWMSLKSWSMILLVTANLKEIEEKGRNYQWVRPEVCLRCRGSRLWGHGFVESWFDGYVCALLLRRYRCPLCGCIIKLKPKGYFKRFQAETESIRFHIVSRLKTDKWPGGCSISARCRHWLRALKREPLPL